MKQTKLRDIKRIFRNYFITVFMILLITMFISALSVSSDRSQYRLTGEKHERITADDIKNSCISLLDVIK